jgi:hypothetical protein
MPEPIQLVAVYTGDSPNYHVFQIVDGEDFVGSIYVRKTSDNGIPEGVELSFVTPSRDKFLWTKGMNELLNRAREGSKAEQKLIRTLKKYE